MRRRGINPRTSPLDLPPDDRDEVDRREDRIGRERYEARLAETMRRDPDFAAAYAAARERREQR